MVNETESPAVIARPGAGGNPPTSGGGLLGKFQALPRQTQLLLVVGGLAAVFFLLSGRGGSNPGRNADLNLGVATPTNPSPTFGGIEITGRPALMQSVYEQQRREMSELREKMDERFEQRDKAQQEAFLQMQEIQRQTQQMLADSRAEIQNLQDERARDAERLAQLAQQQQLNEFNAPSDGASGPSPINRRKQITQVTLGGSVIEGGVQGLLAPLKSAAPASAKGAANQRPPFMPPIGFVRATMLNGVDALVGGAATPGLVRLSGNYRTAMNTTVNLDGCFALMEFSGNISTERAQGKPVRMTCVYPDSGAATYSLSGYVVDAQDGIIGIPGVLYEGDPTRIAAATLADFAAGVGQIVVQNQQTSTVDADGTERTTLTGDQARSQVAGGVNKAMSSLRDYLMERVNRVQPFIRIDATRELNLVILNGTELRSAGSPWTLLFDGNAADSNNNADPASLLQPAETAPQSSTP